MLTIICGFIGAKFLFILTQLKEFIQNPLGALSGSGFVVYGGIIWGLIVALIYCRVNKLSLLKYTDMAVPAVALAQGFGRIGCLLAGCCYGKEYTGFGSIAFHNSKFAPNDISLFPIQILMSIMKNVWNR